MDDELTLRVAFPIGDDGETITLREPSGSQIFTLSMIKTEASEAAMAKQVRRVFMIIEKLAGPDEWDKLQDGMADERFTVMDTLGLINDLVRFDWKGAQPDRGPVEADPEPEPQPARPVPRVVGHG